VSDDAARGIHQRVRPCCSMTSANCIVAVSIVVSLSPEYPSTKPLYGRPSPTR